MPGRTVVGGVSLAGSRAWPDVVEVVGGRVWEYWFEGFRRVVVVWEDGCVLLSIDVYRDGVPLGLVGGCVGGRVEGKGADVVVCRMGCVGGCWAPRLRGAGASWAELVFVEAGGRRETVSVRLYYCGVGGPPSWGEVWGVYRAVVDLVEGRDPFLEPLAEGWGFA